KDIWLVRNMGFSLSGPETILFGLVGIETNTTSIFTKSKRSREKTRWFQRLKDSRNIWQKPLKPRKRRRAAIIAAVFITTAAPIGCGGSSKNTHSQTATSSLWEKPKRKAPHISLFGEKNFQGKKYRGKKSLSNGSATSSRQNVIFSTGTR